MNDGDFLHIFILVSLDSLWICCFAFYCGTAEQQKSFPSKSRVVRVRIILAPRFLFSCVK